MQNKFLFNATATSNFFYVALALFFSSERVFLISIMMLWFTQWVFNFPNIGKYLSLFVIDFQFNFSVAEGHFFICCQPLWLTRQFFVMFYRDFRRMCTFYFHSVDRQSCINQNFYSLTHFFFVGLINNWEKEVELSHQDGKLCMSINICKIIKFLEVKSFYHLDNSIPSHFLFQFYFI